MRRAVAGAAVALALLGTACESTFDKAARKQRAQAAVIAATKLKISANDAVSARVVKVLIREDDTSAVVVELTSIDPKQGLLWAPIDVRLLDATGAVVAETNVEGADPVFVHVPFVPAGGTSFYVNDLLAPTATPVTAEVTLGGTPITVPAPAPKLAATVHYVDDPDPVVRRHRHQQHRRDAGAGDRAGDRAPRR